MKQIKTKILFLLFALILTLSLASCSLFCSHESALWQISTEATLLERGERQKICEECGKVLATESIPRLELSEEEISSALRASVVKVYSYSYDGVILLSQGSGFFIDDIGTFVTNAHVIKDTYILRIKTADGKTHSVSRLYSIDGESSDYAVCRADVTGNSYVKFSEDVEKGDTVYALGYPNDAISLTVTRGELLSKNTLADGVHYYASNAEIHNGSSGGVLANAQGEVIGITSCLFDNNSYGAIRYADIKDAIEYRDSFKAPAEEFHKTDRITVNDGNIGEYIQINSSATPSRDLSDIYLSIFLTLPERYRECGMSIVGTSLDFTLSLSVNVKYKTSGGNEIEKLISNELNMSVYTVSDLIKGIDVSTRVYPGDVLISELSYEYELRLSGASGELTVYDAE